MRARVSCSIEKLFRSGWMASWWGWLDASGKFQVLNGRFEVSGVECGKGRSCVLGLDIEHRGRVWISAVNCTLWGVGC